MSHKELLQNTIQKISSLEDGDLLNLNAYITELAEQKNISKAFSILATESKSFEFLNEEKELYSDKDLIEKF